MAWIAGRPGLASRAVVAGGENGFEENRAEPLLGSRSPAARSKRWLGQAAFSTALQCTDTSVPEDDAGEHPAPELFGGALGSRRRFRGRDGGD